MHNKSEMTVLCYKCCLSRNQNYEMILILANIIIQKDSFMSSLALCESLIYYET